MWADQSITRTHKQPANRDHPAWQRRLTAERDKCAPCSPPLSPIDATFALSLSALPSSSLSALIQLCICILNDSIMQDPAGKITDVFHYFSPPGHRDPSGAPITPPPPFSLHSFLSTCLYFLPLSLSHPPLPDKHSFAFLWLRGNNS